jgi:hypothetical protein
MTDARAWMALGMALVDMKCLDRLAAMDSSFLPLAIQASLLKAIIAKDKVTVARVLGLTSDDGRVFEAVLNEVAQDIAGLKLNKAREELKALVNGGWFILPAPDQVAMLKAKLKELEEAIGDAATP